MPVCSMISRPMVVLPSWNAGRQCMNFTRALPVAARLDDLVRSEEADAFSQMSRASLGSRRAPVGRVTRTSCRDAAPRRRPDDSWPGDLRRHDLTTIPGAERRRGEETWLG